MNGSERQISRVDRQLWQRFVAIAQPYWFPTGPGQGWIFFGLLVLLLIFLFAFLTTLVSGITLISQSVAPKATQEIAGGLIKIAQGLLNSPAGLVVGAALIIPAAIFVFVGNRLRDRWQQWGLLAVLLLLSLSVSGLNVVISYVARFFQTALAEKNQPEYWRFLFVYASVFVVGTPIVVIYRYMQQFLGVNWRAWMTESFLGRYFQNRAYYDINSNEKIDNPDQRISEDIRSFTGTSLSFLLIILGAIINLFAFTGILFSISPLLAGVLIGYAIFGTAVTILFGKRLIGLNFNQLRKEADFRYGLVHVRDNAESIAFYRGEEQESQQVMARFREAFRNFNLLIGWQRNVGFFTTGYDYFVVILPALFVAPLYFAGQLDFGAITQATVAFNQVLNALSIVVERIESLSAFAAGITRLATFSDALTEEEQAKATATTIETVEEPRISLESVTLMTPKNQRMLVRELSANLQPGEGLVIVGPSGVGKSSILRAIAGLWSTGQGRIVRPSPQNMLFLPQRPYMLLGNLRAQLQYPNTHQTFSDDILYQVLKRVNLSELPERVGGLDTELDWADVLSLGEQQRLAFARLLLNQPPYAVLDEATSALDLRNEAQLYQQLRDSETTYISVGHRSSMLQYHQYVLELTGETQWRLLPLAEYQPQTTTFA